MSDSFQQWFSGSKVVDQAGRPQVVYHGTLEQFQRFDFSVREGYFFASNRDVAGSYASRSLKEEQRARDRRPELREAIERLTGESVERAGMLLVNGHFDAHPDRAEIDSAFERLSAAEDAINRASELYFADHDVDESGTVHAVVLALKDPLIHNPDCKELEEQELSDLIRRARELGHDGVIVRATTDNALAGGHYDPVTDVFIAFKSEQIRPASDCPRALTPGNQPETSDPSP